jgi:hypothetical protein
MLAGKIVPVALGTVPVMLGQGNDSARAVERCPSVRDRAIALLLFYTGLRISECGDHPDSYVKRGLEKGRGSERDKTPKWKR